MSQTSLTSTLFLSAITGLGTHSATFGPTFPPVFPTRMFGPPLPYTTLSFPSTPVGPQSTRGS